MKLQFTGDIAFVGEWTPESRDKMFQHVSMILEDADFTIGNLECVLTNQTKGLKNKCTLKCDPSWAKILRKNKINIVSLANNHIMDFQKRGLDETLHHLKKQNIQFFGAGENKRKAQKPLIVQKDGIKIALIGRSSVIVSSPVYATGENPGVALMDERELIAEVKSVKAEYDLVILVLHWGIEHYKYPSPQQRMQARRLLEAGVDILIGHHPHVLQGYENLNGKYVFYSLGNFIFNDFTWKIEHQESGTKVMATQLNAANRTGGILRMDFSAGKKIHFEFVPTFIHPNGEIKLLHNKNILEQYSRLFHFPFYSFWWKLYSLWMEWNLRLSKRYGLKNIIKNIGKIRLHHFIEFVQILKRSLKITKGESTNPYE